MIRGNKRYLSIALLFAVVGGLAVPAVAGAATDTTTINSDIGSVISITSSGTVDADVTPSGAGAQTIASDTITVNTNDTDGYTLQLADSDATTALTSGSDTIPASSGTPASPIAQTANTWGFRIDGQAAFGPGAPTTSQSSQPIGSATFAGVPASGSPATVKTTAAVATDDLTTVWYGVAADTTQPTGSYTDEVTYTATAN